VVGLDRNNCQVFTWENLLASSWRHLTLLRVPVHGLLVRFYRNSRYGIPKEVNQRRSLIAGILRKKNKKTENGKHPRSSFPRLEMDRWVYGTRVPVGKVDDMPGVK